MNRKQALAMLAFISDLYLIIHETKDMEPVNQATSNGQVSVEDLAASQAMRVE